MRNSYRIESRNLVFKMKAQLKQKRIKLLDTGQRNEGFALRVSYPEEDYKPKRKRDNRQYMNEYNKRPEVIEHRKQWLKEYLQRPEVKQRLKAYVQRPYQKERIKLYAQEYNKRPEVIARRRTSEKLAEKAAYDKLYSKRETKQRGNKE